MDVFIFSTITFLSANTFTDSIDAEAAFRESIFITLFVASRGVAVTRVQRLGQIYKREYGFRNYKTLKR